jgi:glucokinase
MDLGGTNLRSAVVDAGGGILWKTGIPTPPEADREEVVAAIAGICREAVSRARDLGDVRAVGAGAAGPLDAGSGVVFTPPNIPGLRNVALAAELDRAVSLPAFVENDANAAAYGEYRAGAGRGAESLVVLTLGTGVGGGIVLGGELLRGAHGTAAEIGHMVLDPTGPPCGCGSRGCLEQYASAPAAVRRWHRSVEDGTFPPPADWSGPLEGADAADLYRLAQAGDPAALAAFAETGRCLGEAIGSLVNVLDPETVVLTGGLAGAAEFFLPALEKTFASRAVSPAREKVRILTGTLGGDAGLVGAALLALERLPPA